MMDPRPFRRFKKNKGAITGALLASLVVGTALIGPLAAPYDPDRQYANALEESTGAPVPPGTSFTEPDGEQVHFVLGADNVGRDELSRLLHGGFASLSVALSATACTLLVGLFIGLTAGYIGGTYDLVMMRVVEVIQSLPFLLIAMALNRAIDSPAVWSLTLVLAALSWTSLARITRAKTMQVKELEYIQAARALGMSPARTMALHILPNVIGPAIVIGTTLVAQMIIAESAMSFLGIGVQPPTATWGSMLHDGQEFLAHEPRYVLLPSALIVATVFGFNLLGEGLRDAFDPKD